MLPYGEFKDLFSEGEKYNGLVVSIDGDRMSIATRKGLQEVPYVAGIAVKDRVIVDSNGVHKRAILATQVYDA